MTGVHADVLATALADALALAALGALLVTAILHLPWRQEAAVAVVATVVVLATGLVSRDELEDTVRALLPVVVSPVRSRLQLPPTSLSHACGRLN